MDKKSPAFTTAWRLSNAAQYWPSWEHQRITVSETFEIVERRRDNAFNSTYGSFPARHGRWLEACNQAASGVGYWVTVSSNESERSMGGEDT